MAILLEHCSKVRVISEQALTEETPEQLTDSLLLQLQPSKASCKKTFLTTITDILTFRTDKKDPHAKGSTFLSQEAPVTCDGDKVESTAALVFLQRRWALRSSLALAVALALGIEDGET